MECPRRARPFHTTVAIRQSADCDSSFGTACQGAQQREHDGRVALAENEEPHPGPGSQDGRKSRRTLDNDRYWNERRPRLIEEAPVTTEERDGREYVVRHLAPQFGPVSEFRRASGVSNAPRG